MGAADLLANVRAAGFTLELADGKLLVTPASMLTDELRAALRACKPELIALIEVRSQAASGKVQSRVAELAAATAAPSADAAEIAAFTTRTERFALLGRADADELAERLTLRDRDGDDRRLCLECTALAATRRCLVATRGRLHGATRLHEPVPTILQRCPGFTLAHAAFITKEEHPS